MYKLVLVRHGQSQWNLENRFTGWTDVELTEKGKEEAKEAGIAIKKAGLSFDIAYTSVLKRAKETLEIILKEIGQEDISRTEKWRLNERHYGALQGLNKDETKEKYGEEQVKLWRRSSTVRPPALELNDPRYPGNDIKYLELKNDELPRTENLVDTIQRVKKFWDDHIVKRIKRNEKVIIVAHGNSLRGLVKELKGLTEEETLALEIPTGKPLVLEIDENLKVVNDYYLN